MGPIVMASLIVGMLAMFAWSASRRWQLLQVGRPADIFNRIAERIEGTWRYAFRQEKMDYYSPAGLAHKLIFTGFIVLLLRTLILWGRGFYPAWNLIFLSPENVVGRLYEFTKDVIATLVVVGALVFVYYRVIRPQKRMTLSGEGLMILGIIITMMLSDMAYDGASQVLAFRHHELCGVPNAQATVAQCGSIATIIAPLSKANHAEGGILLWAAWPSPAGSAFAVLFKSLSPGALIAISHAGFWTHSTLVLVFLNLLPHSKHFHVITGIPNVFFQNLEAPGRLKPMAENAEKLMEMVGAAAEASDPRALPIGASRIEHFSWKAILDFYTCTECGRCSDNCPAHRTGKVLSPKHFTLALRDHLYQREGEFIEAQGVTNSGVILGGALVAVGLALTALTYAAAKSDGGGRYVIFTGLIAAGILLVLRGQKPRTKKPTPTPTESETAPVDLGITAHVKAINIEEFIHPDVVWACTSCRACEEQCPVMISYVDKIVDIRRNLVLVKGEFPPQLAKPFQGMEVNGNPWNLSRMDRAAWSDGLGISMMAEKPNAAVLFWVGCAASYDDRAKKIARATSKLLKQANVDFAILGQEENCTGDPARRAGNEFLFAMLAEGNAATLNGYKEQGGAKTIITTCPHCFNSLKNEYPDFGAKFEVVHHTDYLLGLVAEGKLKPTKAVKGRVVYHDSCYLGRYNGVYESPREILRRIPGVELVEPEYWNKQRGLCCGAGGAQMFMEEQNHDRVNVKRTLQLIDTKPDTIASACPFCMTMLTDGLKSKSLEEKIQQLDVVELLEKSCEEQVIAAPPPLVEVAAE